MTKQEQKDALFSLSIIHGYLKHYGLEDYDRDHVLMHLKPIVEMIEKDKLTKENIYSKDTE
jgi:hypothetical protein